MKIVFKQSALKDLEKLTDLVSKRILNKLTFFISQKDVLKYTKPMVNKDFGSYRFRIGDYRVIFDLEKDKIIILVIGHRKDIYK